MEQVVNTPPYYKEIKNSAVTKKEKTSPVLTENMGTLHGQVYSDS
jgi:hypothetical protein